MPDVPWRIQHPTGRVPWQSLICIAGTPAHRTYCDRRRNHQARYALYAHAPLKLITDTIRHGPGTAVIECVSSLAPLGRGGQLNRESSVRARPCLRTRRVHAHARLCCNIFDGTAPTTHHKRTILLHTRGAGISCISVGPRAGRALASRSVFYCRAGAHLEGSVPRCYEITPLWATVGLGRIDLRHRLGWRCRSERVAEIGQPLSFHLIAEAG